MIAPDRRRARGWVDHVRSGGTTPWSDWQDRADWPERAEQAEQAEQQGHFLPGAQQLELLRRVNLAARTSVPTELAGRILTASAPGRGRPDLELVGAGAISRFGPRPVDPVALPADELVRVATGLLADDLLADDLVAAGPPRTPRPLTRPWRRAYRMVGDPALADAFRAQLVARGRPPGGRHPRILVLCAPLDRMLASAFTARSFDTGGPAWPEWVAISAARDRLAPRVDLVRVARTWAERVGHDRVTIVVDPHAVPELVGVRGRLVVPPPLSADAVELARRVASVLGLLVAPDRRASLLREGLAPRLRDAVGGALAVPDAHRDWLSGRARQLRDDLRRAGHQVAGGDLDVVLPTYAPAGPVDPDGEVGVADERLLELAIGLLLRASRPGREAIV